jgi:SPP1 gp7 family putative phage head morphogenesis protein
LKGQEEGLSLPKIATELEKYYEQQSAYKAMRVARTEVAQSAGFGQREAAEQSGVAKSKTWLSARDDRVRDSHAEIDGETIAFDEKYSNGLMYPGDPSGGPEEVINCRCVETYGTE